MKSIEFFVDDVKYSFSTTSEKFYFGNDIVFSDEKSDLSYKQKWYNDGFTVESFLNDIDFMNLRLGITESIKKIILNDSLNSLDTFNLENYHKFITSEKEHFSIVSKTRKLNFDDFNINLLEYIKKFEKILGFSLTNVDPETKNEIPIIVRINRPKSKDFNPPHKDMYEVYDSEKKFPKFINFWIPICGVNEKSSLPISISSHLISESKICRTIHGGNLDSNEYRVRLIKNWGDNKLTRVPIKCGEVLIFSSHLIHGLATNENEDLTRVALEFRLYEK